MYTTWTIYSIGDVAFLEQILIGVAMVTGAGDFSRAASIGLLFALLILSFQSISKGAQELNYQQAFAGWMLFALMFWPTTTVAIEDGVTGDVRVVAHVPYGVGAAGGMISSIGYGLTELFEQGYSYIAPGLTESRFADSLKILNNLKRASEDPRVVAALNNAAGGDLRRSWDNYIRECSLVKIDLGLTTADQLLSQPMPEALRFDSGTYTTKHYMSGVNGTTASCSVVFDVLRSATSGAMLDSEFNKVLGQALGQRETSPYGFEPSMNQLANAMDTLHISQVDAYRFVQASVLQPLYEGAVVGKYQDMHDFTSAVMINQAIQQRNLQWAAEQSMFMSVVRPMQTFFEGFVYALTPLIGVLIIMGSFGMTLAFKYLQTLLWIQFWLPVLSIVNLYIHVGATEALSSFDNPDMTSIYSLMGTYDVLQQWVSVGGMLAAATPVISLFLVTGSTYAMTSLAGKISGADHVNEKAASPDVVQPGSLMQMQPKFSANAFSGATRSGAEGLISNMTFDQMLGGQIASAEQKSVQAQEQFGNTLSRTVDSAAMQGRESQVLSQLGRTTSSLGTKTASTVDKVASQIVKDFGLKQDQQDAVAGAVSLTASGGKSAGGFKFGATGTGSSTSSDTKTISSGDIQKRLDDVGFDKGESAQFSRQLAESLQVSGGDKWSHMVGDKAAKSLTAAASEVTSAGKSFEEVAKLGQSFGTSANARLDQVAGALSNPDILSSSPESRAALQDLNDHFRYGNASPAVQENALAKSRFFESMGKSPQMAQVMGRLAAMMNVNNYGSSAEAMEGIKTAAGVVNQAIGNDIALPSKSPVDNQGMQGPAFAPGAVSAAATAATGAAAGIPLGDHWDNAGRAYAPVKETYGAIANQPGNQDPNPMLVDDFQTNVSGVENTHQANRKDLTDEALNKNLDNLAAANLGVGGRGDRSASTTLFGAADNWFDQIKNSNENFYGEMGKVLQGMPADEALAHFRSNMEEYRQQAVVNAQNDYGLTPQQATLLAYEQTGAGSERIEQARADLINSYPEQHRETAEHVANHIQYAAGAGEQAGSYLFHVQENNALLEDRGELPVAQHPSSRGH